MAPSKFFDLIKNVLLKTKLMKCAGLHSNKTNLGVSQGSFFGPLLFIIFGNDFPAIIGSNKNLTIYVGDNNHKYFNQSLALNHYQEILNKLKTLLNKKDLSLNIAKIVFMQFTPHISDYKRGSQVANNTKSIAQVSIAKLSWV